MLPRFFSRVLRCFLAGNSAGVLANRIWYVCCAEAGEDSTAALDMPCIVLPVRRSSLTHSSIDALVSALLPLWCAANISRSTSTASRKVSTISEVMAISFLRMRSSRVSRIWVTSVMSVKPNVPLPPLMECAARKMAFNWSASGTSRSIASNRLSMLPRCSMHSSKNAW